MKKFSNYTLSFTLKWFFSNDSGVCLCLCVWRYKLIHFDDQNALCSKRRRKTIAAAFRGSDSISLCSCCCCFWKPTKKNRINFVYIARSKHLKSQDGIEIQIFFFLYDLCVYDVFCCPKIKNYSNNQQNQLERWNSLIIIRFIIQRLLSLGFYLWLFFEKKKYFKRHLLVVPTMRVFARLCIIQPWYTQNRKRWTNSSFVRKKRVDSTTNTNIIITFAPLFQMAATFLLRQCWKTL